MKTYRILGELDPCAKTGATPLIHQDYQKTLVGGIARPLKVSFELLLPVNISHFGTEACGGFDA